MAVDHTRELPVAHERLDHLAQIYDADKFRDLKADERAAVLQIALLGEQVEATNNLNFFLSEAYDIYNARFR